MKWRALVGLYVPPLLLLAVFALLPAFGLQPNAVRLLFISFVFITASVAWNILGGFAGQVSFGHAALFAVGAYTTIILYLKGGLAPLSSRG